MKRQEIARRDGSTGPAALFDGLLTGLGYLAGLILLATAIGIGFDVVMRAATGGGLPWLIDVVEYGLLVATFAGAPWVLRRRGHVSIDLLVDNLPARPQYAMRRTSALIGMVVTGVLTVIGVMAAIEAAQKGSLVFKAIVFPEWWMLAVVPAGLALCAIEFARQAARPDGDRQ